MATTIGFFDDMGGEPGASRRFYVTRFAAGDGKMGYQFTIGSAFVQLTDDECDRLVGLLLRRATADSQDDYDA